MKFPLHKKFLLFYLNMAALMIIFIATAGQHLIRGNVTRAEERRLYSIASTLSGMYRQSYSSQTLDFDQISDFLSQTSQTSSTDIWIVDKNGHIDYSVSGQTGDIKGFDPTACDARHGYVGDFYGRFSERTISVYAPMVQNYTTSGYIIVHRTADDLFVEINDTVNVMYIISGFLFLISFLMFGLLHLTILYPLKKITKSANEYAAGNLNYEYIYHSNDELGYLSKTLSYMAKALSDINEDQRKFVANVSHDFRSPLTSIKGYVEAMLDGTIPPSMQEKYLTVVRDETDRLNKLTQSLLDLNAFSKNGTYLDITEFDINHIIKKILATFEGRCETKKITFDLTFPSEEFFVKADMGKIQQVLYNLIDNAIKFSPPGSAIHIETYPKYEKAYISVKDEGVGINAENLKKIWDRFYKTDTSRGKDKKGLGLGLSITKEIIKAHGENIDVVSTEGVGTQFTFTLPLAQKKSV